MTRPSPAESRGFTDGSALERAFNSEFPEWRVLSLRPFMPFRYLISGGVSMRSLMPAWTFGLWRALEGALTPWSRQLGMFAQIVLERTDARASQ